MTDRLTCLIPGCRRTHLNRQGFSDWVCGKHWALVPKPQRQEMATLRRRGQHAQRNALWNHAVDDLIARCLSGADLLG